MLNVRWLIVHPFTDRRPYSDIGGRQPAGSASGSGVWDAPTTVASWVSVEVWVATMWLVGLGDVLVDTAMETISGSVVIAGPCEVFLIWPQADAVSVRNMIREAAYKDVLTIRITVQVGDGR